MGLVEDDRRQDIIRIPVGVARQQSQHVACDTMLDFVETPKPIRMPKIKR
jgi:hypothetical protein